MRQLTDDDRKFLADLRDELNTQDTVCQADPRFWVVEDTVEEPCWEGQAERFILTDDEGNEVGTLDHYESDGVGGYGCVPVKARERIARDTMFMTLRECREHIERNRHHYNGDAHPYAMTAWRSPQVERLWKILQEVEWEAVTS